MKLSRVSCFDIAFMYMYLNEPDMMYGPRNKERRREILGNINELLNNGWCTEDIVRHMWNNYSVKERNTDLMEMPKAPGERRRNLLKSEMVYFHNYLYISPKFPVLSIDEESGGVKESSSRFFREQIASINLDQICDYYLMHDTLRDSLSDSTELRGSIKYLINKVKDIDLILFCMDVAEDLSSNGDRFRIRKAFDILNFTKQAKEDMSCKKTLFIEQYGKQRIVQKKRDKGHEWMALIESIVTT